MARKSAPAGVRKKTAPKQRPKGKSEVTLSGPPFRARWIEMTGRKPPSRVPQPLANSVATLRANPPANPDIQIFARKIIGKDCEKVAEIAGWYSMDLTKGGKCIGAAKVKAALDAAAKQFCCQTLQCPSRCPCAYVPQPKLGAYYCIPGKVEEGFLLQATEVWNCFCLEQ